MKRFTKLCLILAAVLTICGLGTAAAGYAGGAIRDIRSSASLPAGEAETIDVSAENLGRVEFRLTSEYVTIFPSQDGNLHVEYTPLADHQYDHRLESSLPNGKNTFIFSSYSQGTVSFLRHFRFDFGLASDMGFVKIWLPENVDVSLLTTSGSTAMDSIAAGVVDVSTTSGSIILSGITAQSLSAASTSGEQALSDCQISGDTAFSSVSGNTELTGSTIGGSLHCSSTSGEITLKSVAIQSPQPAAVYLSAISGDIRLESAVIQGGLELSSTSGEITLSPATVFGSISAETTSGSVCVKLEGAPAHRMGRLSSTSGSISVTGGDENGQSVISVSTTSGEISIQD